MAEETHSVQQGSPVRGPSTSWRLVAFLSLLAFVGFLLFDRPTSMAQGEGDRDDFSGTAFLSGMERRIDGQDFRRGDATAFMGGVKIDLSDAQMAGNEAVLDLSSVMGGITVRVPYSWTVVSHVNTIMGGFKDETRHPADSSKKLILKGTVIMGGLKLEN